MRLCVCNQDQQIMCDPNADACPWFESFNHVDSCTLSPPPVDTRELDAVCLPQPFNTPKPICPKPNTLTF